MGQASQAARNPLLSLAPTELRALAAALRSGRLTLPISGVGVQRYVPGQAVDRVTAGLQQLANDGMSAAGVARCLELIADSDDSRPAFEDLLDIVTTGPELGGVANRDTGVVVSGLFREANHSVIVAGYAVHQGERVFQTLSQGMIENPSLSVKMFLDIQRRPGETTSSAQIVAQFCHRFKKTEWPTGAPLPEVYYSPQSLVEDRHQAGALHAKCIVVDSEHVFVSSANFTEAAQERNIEVGVLLHSRSIGDRVTRFFTALIEGSKLVRIL